MKSISRIDRYMNAARQARGEVLFFALDYRTDEPARLAVAVLAVKGSCDTVRGGAG